MTDEDSMEGIDLTFDLAFSAGFAIKNLKSLKPRCVLTINSMTSPTMRCWVRRFLLLPIIISPAEA